MAPRSKTVQIRQFIIDHVADHPREIATMTARRFHISRQAACKHLRELEESGVLEGEGRTRSRSYRLRTLERVERTVPVTGLEEHVPWQNEILPRLQNIPKNVLQICSYGFTEMLNNVIDHSGSPSVHYECLATAESIDLKIVDQGVGIFRKIRSDLGLNDELEAIAELAKGKLTTDPRRHTGEGIFFTSRMFDCFSILSGHLFFSHVGPNDDWLIEDRSEACEGTYVRMTISVKAKTVMKEVFDRFASSEGDYEFSKTHVPVKLLQYGTDNLVSRSQAKRLLARFEMFKEVILDFDGVEEIGQAFADEVFRVYRQEHPDVRLFPIRTNPNVLAMIHRAGHR